MLSARCIPHDAPIPVAEVQAPGVRAVGVLAVGVRAVGIRAAGVELEPDAAAADSGQARAGPVQEVPENRDQPAPHSGVGRRVRRKRGMAHRRGPATDTQTRQRDSANRGHSHPTAATCGGRSAFARRRTRADRHAPPGGHNPPATREWGSIEGQLARAGPQRSPTSSLNRALHITFSWSPPGEPTDQSLRSTPDSSYLRSESGAKCPARITSASTSTNAWSAKTNIYDSATVLVSGKSAR